MRVQPANTHSLATGQALRWGNGSRLTRMGVQGQFAAMLRPEDMWPFGLVRGGFPRFIGIVLLLFVGLAFLDPLAVAWSRSLPPWVTIPFGGITRLGQAEWILVPSLVIGVWGWLRSRRSFSGMQGQQHGAPQVYALSLFIFFSTALPGLLANILKRLIGRARPVHLEQLGLFHFQPFSDWTFQSIPSGHTSTMFAFATGIMFLFPRLSPWAFLLAALVGFSRIVLGMHYPTDVFAGMLTGIISAYAVRNFWLSRGWLFVRTGEGVVRRSAGPGRAPFPDAKAQSRNVL